jgi:L-asparaginase
MQPKIVILGTGGTIAGTAASAADAVGYTAAQIGVAQLVAAVPLLAQVPIECEQVAQLDSKDMDFETWQRLAASCAHHLARADVAGIVVTHGTDTLEETAYFLHRVLAAAKPVVLTGAMRPATSLQADGPQNLLDAVRVAQEPGARGVVAAMAGTVHGAHVSP